MRTAFAAYDVDPRRLARVRSLLPGAVRGLHLAEDERLVRQAVRLDDVDPVEGGLLDEEVPDHDPVGAVDAQEMAAGHAMMHGDHDRDDHGMGAGMHAGMMARMDASHDGVLTAAEHATAAKAMFERMDANHDGKVTTAEMQAGHAAMSHEMGEHDGAMGEHDAHGMGGMPMAAGDQAGMSRRGEHMRAMDTNHDGRITAAEHAAAAQAMFARMDANHDGYLSRAEVKAGHGMGKTP